MRRLLGLRGPARPSAPRHRFRNGRHRPQRPAGRVRGPPRSSPQRAAPPRPALRAVRAQLRRLRLLAATARLLQLAARRFSLPKQLKSFAENLEVTYRIARAKTGRFTAFEKAVLASPLLRYSVLPLLPCCGDLFDF